MHQIVPFCKIFLWRVGHSPKPMEQCRIIFPKIPLMFEHGFTPLVVLTFCRKKILKVIFLYFIGDNKIKIIN